MALGTPVAGAFAYSASGGTTVDPAYPASIVSTDALILVVGQKPSSANGGTVTTPTGWTLRDELTGAGGYGATLGADTGNTNLRFYTKNTVLGTETGTLAVTLATNGVSWATIIRVPSGGGALSFNSSDADDQLGGAVQLVCAADPGFTANDMALWAMCIPTDVTTPAQFSSHAINATGATFGAATEIGEADSTTGNDIGGYLAWAMVTAGPSSAVPTMTAAAAGTTTNVRGPGVVLRIREDSGASLLPPLTTNASSFPAATVAPGPVGLTPTALASTLSFHSAAVGQAGANQNLAPALLAGGASFPAASVLASNTLAPGLLSDGDTFFAATVAPGAVALTPALLSDGDSFPAASVGRGAVNLAPGLLSDGDTFFAATVAPGAVALTPALLSDGDSFPAASVGRGAVNLAPALLADGDNFPAASVSNGSGPQSLLPALLASTATFYAASVAPGAVALAAPLLADGDSFPAAAIGRGPVNLAPSLLSDGDSFFAPALAASAQLLPALLSGTAGFPAASVTPGAVALLAPLVANDNQFFAATVVAVPFGLLPPTVPRPVAGFGRRFAGSSGARPRAASSGRR